MTKESDWLIPSVLLTMACGIAVLLHIPDYRVLWAAMTIYPAWMAAALVLACLCLFARMVRQRVASPALELRRILAHERGRLTLTALAIALAGLNMITFMWVKPLLNYLVPFWAGPWLAKLDWLLFLGNDPWTLLGWLNFPAAGLIYHPAWFAMIILALLIVAWAPASPEKSAMLLSYFTLWTLVGPVIHTLLPAAGPLFFERLGYGARFAELHQWSETRQVADYLWTIYASRNFGAGSGISAMPSMHVTMATWSALAISTFARGFAVPAKLFALLIFLMSIALGWHYAADGLVGAAAALCCHRALLAWFRREARPRRRTPPAMAIAPSE